MNQRRNIRPAVLQFVGFATASLAAGVVDYDHPLAVSDSEIGPRTFNEDALIGKVLILDGDRIFDVHFIRSRVVFKGRPSSLRNVLFTDCILEFPVNENPAPIWRIMGQELLSSNFKEFSISNAG